ncbi:hypothetical protein SD457_01290 [Coprobacillaceae bacterium CR2/5/TPMF4]|nr:hypothetical protein SD457_01290 [Coprobacillaceae bacterium CR2/5/TPMF4]
MSVKTSIQKLGLEKIFDYVYRDPDKNLVRVIDWADKFSSNEFESQRKIIREAITNPQHPYYSFIRRIINDVDSNVVKTLAVNFSSMQLWLAGQFKKKIGKNIIAIYLGQFY